MSVVVLGFVFGSSRIGFVKICTLTPFPTNSSPCREDYRREYFVKICTLTPICPEDFPRNHNLILIGQPALNTTLQLRVNHDLKTRVTYSAKLEALTSAHLAEFIHSQLDRVGLPHSTFTEEAINLITRSSEGILRAVKNLCIGAMIEAVRDRSKTVDLKQVNAVLLQPHWRHNTTAEPTEPVLIPPRNLPAKS